ncbi:putative HTH-type transcriptional regulator YbbH [Streptococcus sanguinis]|jgi:transcriptional regulator, rpiR family (phosphosugar-binding), putative|uniref:Transcriptional regulator, RpiR family (Phosphosugar-binding), putative n=1 Tax=Streptococcus sanguinis (strain SK36) TaxID=388919 RepID=A3CK40_STRSV|nr:MurR/RpiR family transcriptional regulator [Streptococcus sanguinis]ABN43545.1 Transcriptional regulator, RpiR family (phosphosugar-binding), putative [Streptococcus sanguinis SK36]MBZ2056004.1 MurR/RpiR family transcriptional regulator [Streptococcus sanguinis]RSI04516.1 putative HTH-type transcriptional regulator YbbH [Streptococcus sanguinis]RSI16733.1 putative HTH-type transcriptional regulator YbbH [Streptococcus sanguinis]RSI46653.1 putative HTH-type transcriptional regulator YbbH [St
MSQQNILAIIESHLDKMTDLEQRIGHYFLDPNSIQEDLSSLQVAQTLHISQAALTRFAKKCGFKGYREFSFQYLQDLQKAQTEADNMPSSLSRHVLYNYNQIHQQTKELIDEEKLERVAQIIEEADRVYFFGTGSSGLVARDMKLRFMRLGVVCEALTDQDGFAWTTSILDKNCLVIGFSLSGQTQSIIDSLIDAKNMGAKTILVTGQPEKIQEDFTEVVPVALQSKPEFILRISAQFPMLLMIDLIYAFFLEINREKKERIFNSFWENQKLNGYYRRNIHKR